MVEAHLFENKCRMLTNLIKATHATFTFVLRQRGPDLADILQATSTRSPTTLTCLRTRTVRLSSFSLPRQHPSSAPCLVCTPATSGLTCPASPLLSSQEDLVGSIVGRPTEKKRPSATADARLSATAEARPSTTADPNHSHLTSDWTIRRRPPGLRISGARPSVSVAEGCFCRRH